MTPLKRFAAGAAVAALVASGAACSKAKPAAAPTITPAATSATSSPTASVATPTATLKPTLSQRAQAEADAIAMVKNYYALSDKLASKPPTIAEAKRQLSAVAMSDELAYSIEYLGELRSARQRQTGTVSVSQPLIEKVSLTSEPKAQSAKSPFVDVRVCTDVSDLDLLDATGNSLSNPKRQMRRVVHLEVVSPASITRDGWRIQSIHEEATRC